MPGSVKTVSMTAAPDSRWPSIRPMTVRVGPKEFGSTWRSITRFSGKPFARAWATYSSRKVSMVLARIIRVIAAISVSTMANTGSTRYFTAPRPPCATDSKP
ncbi:hypothetical protein D3C72_1760970 [compost metagenome]